MRRVTVGRALAGAAIIAFLGWLSWRIASRAENLPAPSPGPRPPAAATVVGLAAEIERLKSILPDQAHAMKDVGYHFTNLWFAGKNANWPLAEFYWAEARSHLRRAVRIIPVRKDPKGAEVRLEEILAPIEATRLEEIRKAIAEKDSQRFAVAYQEMLASCYACHLVSGKPFLRLQVPEQPESRITRFDPEP